MKSVLIGGGTGLVGTRLSALLKERGYEVRLLSRKPRPRSAYPTFQWDPEAGTIDAAAFQDLDYIINLAGAGIADQRWTFSRKKLIISSRVNSTNLLWDKALSMPTPPKAFLSASAIGYYGDRQDEWLTESAEPGEGFLSESTQQWERAVFSRETSIRRVAIRIGIVLSTQGGALEKLIMPARFGLGTYFGDGSQWYSWIHIDDLCQLFLFALEQEAMNGIYNGVAPNPVPNKAFTETLRSTIGRPGLSLPVPEFLMRIPMGEMADVVFAGSRVSSKKVQEAGFVFAHPELRPALKDILKREI